MERVYLINTLGLPEEGAEIPVVATIVGEECVRGESAGFGKVIVWDGID